MTLRDALLADTERRGVRQSWWPPDAMRLLIVNALWKMTSGDPAVLFDWDPLPCHVLADDLEVAS